MEKKKNDLKKRKTKSCPEIKISTTLTSFSLENESKNIGKNKSHGNVVNINNDSYTNVIEDQNSHLPKNIVIIENTKLPVSSTNNILQIGYCKQKREKVLIKEFSDLRIYNLTRENYINTNLLEIAEKAATENKNVLIPHHLFDNNKKGYSITKYIEGNDLFNILTDEILSVSDIKTIFRKIIETMVYFHSQRICHHDLKPENILIKNDKKIYIIDWDLAEKIDNYGYVFKRCGTPLYCAPELLIGDEPFNGSSLDVWAIGIILYITIMTSYPFKLPNIQSDIQNNLASHFNKFYQNRNNKIPYEINKYTKKTIYRLHPELIQLFDSIFLFDADRRITINKLYNYPWFTNNSSSLIEISKK